jgi:hypothetical protein
MVDLAIAANFVRELTEEQFSARPRPRREAAAARKDSASRRETAPPRGGPASARREAGSSRRGVRRVLFRLGQVRG